MDYLGGMGIDTRDENRVVIFNNENPEVIIHFPGQEVEQVVSHFFILSAFSGIVLVAFSPSVTQADGFPGAMICSKLFEKAPSNREIRRTITERWKIKDCVVV
jgi:hypothetical protein